MKKPLELTVYPPAECICELRGEYATGYNYACDVVDHGWMRAAVNSKRFTDAELAAEHHSANAKAWRLTAFRSYDSDELKRLEHEFATFRRFASLPHYDEADQ